MAQIRQVFFSTEKRHLSLYIIFSPPVLPILNQNGNKVLETIERELIEKYSEKGDIILMGDFNARTGSEEDLIISDDTSHFH